MNEVERLELEARLMAEFEARVAKMSDKELEALVQEQLQLGEVISRALAVIQNIAVELGGLRLKREGEGDGTND